VRKLFTINQNDFILLFIFYFMYGTAWCLVVGYYKHCKDNEWIPWRVLMLNKSVELTSKNISAQA